MNVGLGYGFLYLLALRSLRVQWATLAVILVSYWLLFALYPLPGPGFDWIHAGTSPDQLLPGFAGHWSLNTNPAWAFDVWFLNLFPQAHPFLYADDGGYCTLSFIPTLGTMILGLITGGVLCSKRAPLGKVRWLAVSGVISLAAGWLLGALGICPVVKRIWTPRWMLFSGGWCLLILGGLYVSAAKRAGDAVPLVIGLERERGLVIARLLREKSDAVLGLATGSTPLLLYRQLIAMKLNWRKVTTFNLDEYVGLGSTHPQSYHSFMQKNLFRHINISKKNIHIPDGMSRDIPGFCASYEKKIRAAGGIDFQVLGIGTDGHIGFNEPTSSLASRTRIKTLTRQTHKDNARFFGSAARVPHHVITMGLGTIMEARQCVLLAFGAKKARAIAATVEGPLAAVNPASILQLQPNVKVCLDEPAAAKLKRRDYYRWVYANKPAWQNF